MSVWEENFGRKTEGKGAGSRRFDLLWRIVCDFICCATAPPQNNFTSRHCCTLWCNSVDKPRLHCLFSPAHRFYIRLVWDEQNLRWTGLRRSLQDACLIEMFLTKSMMGNNLLTTQLNYHIASNKRDAAFSSKMFNLHIWCRVVVLKLCMYIPKHYCSAISEWDMWLFYKKKLT